MNALFLAAAYLRHHWVRSAILVFVTALLLAVPLAAQTLLRGAESRLTARAEATPLLIGARGSALDLVMTGLYFSEDRVIPITQADADAVWDSGLALPIPLHTGFSTNGARIVGTSLDYLEFRGLTLAQGRPFAVLGEAIAGATLADRLGLSPGGTLVSSPENLFDLDGTYPLQMDVTGVLSPTGTPDDEALFTDVKTAWVIAGIGHGHDDVVGADGQTPASITQFTRITPANIDSFHFHGDPGAYPLTAVIAVPHDQRAATILRGRYLEADAATQAVVPEDVVQSLVAQVFRIKSLLDAVMVLTGAAALAALGLALFLAWRLRAPEMLTALRLGARRGMIARLVLAETALVLVAALVLAAPIAVILQSQGESIVTWLLATAPS
ncbi:MAG: hypothetical protein AAFU80_22510 [Pseudomonadota bacterium]